MKKRKLWTTGLFVGAMVFGGTLLTPSFVNAEGSSESPNSTASKTDGDGDGIATSTPETTKWEYSKSKTATNLDKNFESKVTLSLPSAKEDLVSDVVFVLDDSSCSPEVQASVTNVIDELNSNLNTNDSDVKIGVVHFRGYAQKTLELESFKNGLTEDKLKNALKKQSWSVSGSNFPAGLAAAQDMLSKDPVPNNRKFVISITDGVTYLYVKDKDFSEGYSRSTNAQGNGGVAEWPLKYSTGSFEWHSQTSDYNLSNESFDHTDFANITDFDSYFDYINKIPGVRDFDEYDQKYTRKSGEGEWKNIDKEMGSSCPQKEDNANRSRIINVDKSMVQTYDLYTEMENDGINCFTIQPNSTSNFPIFDQFIQKLNNNRAINYAGIQQKILYLVGPGSYVDDYMGYQDGDYNFDLVKPEEMRMYIENDSGSVEVQPTKISDNYYGFVENSSVESGYEYTVRYTPDKQDKEHITWKINVPVTNFEHVKLTYNVKLTNPQTKAGNYTGLRTNRIATLYPKDSSGKDGNKEDFPWPTVSYTVEAEKPVPTETPAQPTATPDVPKPTETPTQPTETPDSPQPSETPAAPTETPEAKKYTVIFAVNGGSEVKPITEDEGSKVELSTVKVSKPGYTFDGWYSDETLTTEVKDVTLDKDYKVYAKWTKNEAAQTATPTEVPTQPTETPEAKKYTVIFAVNGGSEVKPITVDEGSKVELSTVKVSKPGYTFDGWYSDEKLTTEVKDVTLDKDYTVYAKWTKNEAAKPAEQSSAKPTATTKPSEQKQGNSRDTGVHSNVLLYAGMMIIAICIVSTVVLTQKKNEN